MSHFLPVTPMNQPSSPIFFDREISSNTYPITNAWLVQQSIVLIHKLLTLSALLYTAVFGWYVNITGEYHGKSFSEVYFGPNSEMLWLIFFITFIVIYASRLVYNIFWRTNYSFSFLPDYIVTKKGVITKTETHLPYRAIQDVAVSQGMIERMLGIATVRIENSVVAQVTGKHAIPSAIIIPGQPLAKANELSEAIKAVTITKNSTQTGL